MHHDSTLGTQRQRSCTAVQQQHAQHPDTTHPAHSLDLWSSPPTVILHELRVRGRARRTEGAVSCRNGNCPPSYVKASCFCCMLKHSTGGTPVWAVPRNTPATTGSGEDARPTLQQSRQTQSNGPHWPLATGTNSLKLTIDQQVRKCLVRASATAWPAVGWADLLPSSGGTNASALRTPAMRYARQRASPPDAAVKSISGNRPSRVCHARPSIPSPCLVLGPAHRPNATKHLTLSPAATFFFLSARPGPPRFFLD